ncbi:MAG: hypothetical protein LBU09_00240 [Endomicrobium sp.]|jgi:hypothetical protein|nr:hypothetical protein [Endomicrobium sp.]
MKKILAVFMLFILAAPLAFAARLVTPETVDVTLSAENDDVVGKAIWDACSRRKWTPVKKGSNEIVATLNNRQYTVVVSIAYSKDGYSIAYRDSVNMNYNARRHLIHSTYLRWIAILDNDIQIQLARSNDNKF